MHSFIVSQKKPKVKSCKEVYHSVYIHTTSSSQNFYVPQKLSIYSTFENIGAGLFLFYCFLLGG